MDKIYVAKLGRAIGLKGQQKLHIDSDFPEQFKKNSVFYTNKNQKLIIENYNSTSNTVKFIGIDTAEAARKLTNKQLFVSFKDTINNCKLDKKQFFWFDIIGCIVKENGEELGKVTDCQRMPLNDYLQIETTLTLKKQNYSNIFLIPYIDEYIIDVDIAAKTINVHNAKNILEAS